MINFSKEEVIRAYENETNKMGVTPFDIFAYKFGKIPDVVHADVNVDCMDYFLKNGWSVYNRIITVNDGENENENARVTTSYIEKRTTLIKDNVIAAFSFYPGEGYARVTLLFETGTNYDFSFLKDIIKSPKKTSLGIFTKDEFGGLTIKQYDIKLPSDMNIEYNYGKKFTNIHDKLVEKLNDESSGLFIFHGPPGTGKSTYIKGLTNYLKDRKIVYVPEFMVRSLSDPNLVPLLIQNKGAILIIEDAEKFLQKREDSSDNTVSTLLSLSDGMLSDIFHIKIIVTYNTENLNIDPALLRKGRLHYKYEFDKLDIEDSQKLIDRLKIKYKATEPMSLGEIYNILDDNNYSIENEKKEHSIGF